VFSEIRQVLSDVDQITSARDAIVQLVCCKKATN
jgi:hypothetical protein